jgi:hypothetical protein
MANIGQENLETLMIDFFGALRRGDVEAAAELLDPEVSWQGLREEWVCHGREEVIDTFLLGLEQRRERSTHWSSLAAANKWCWARADRTLARRKSRWVRSSMSSRCATRGSFASRISGGGGRRSQRQESPTTPTGIDPPAGLRVPR